MHTRINKIAIIGSGIAGCSAAHFLAQAGFETTVFEREPKIASQASGNRAGVLYPRIEAAISNFTEFYRYAFELLTSFLSQPEAKEAAKFSNTGMLILKTKEQIEKLSRITNRYFKLLSESETNSVAGIDIASSSVFLEESGYLSVPDLCKFLINSPSISLKTNINIIKISNYKNQIELSASDGKNHIFDTVIIANSMEASKLYHISKLKAETIRGQVTILPKEIVTYAPKCVVCSKGYIAPNVQDFHHIGATFDRNNNSEVVKLESHLNNLEKLKSIIKVTSTSNLKGRVGFRSYSNDRLPLIGRVDVHLPIFISAFHGSRGILSGFAGGNLLAKMLTENLTEFEQLILKPLNPMRFVYTNR